MKEFTFGEIAGIIKRQLLAATLMAVVSFSLIIALFLLAQPEYPISARIMLEQSRQQAALDAPIDLVLGGGNSDLTNEIEVFKSRVVLNELIARLNLDYVPERGHNSYIAYLFRHIVLGLDRSGGPVLEDLSPSFRQAIVEFHIETVSEEEFRFRSPDIDSVSCPWGKPCDAGGHKITLKRSGPVSPGARYTYYKENYPKVRESLLNSFYFEVLGDRKNANQLEIELTSRDPFVGAIVLNELVSIVIAKKIEWKRGEAEATRSFIQAVTDKIKMQLNEGRTALAEFQEKNKALLPEIQVQGFVTRNAELLKTRQENDIRKKVLEEFLRQVTGAEHTAISSPVVIANVALEEMISAYNKSLMSLKLAEQSFTENHPQIMIMRQQTEKTKSDIVAVVRDTIANIVNAQSILERDLDGIEQRINGMPLNIKNINTLYSNIATTERIFVFLNQKLYEAEIMSGSTLSGIRLIDDADPWIKKSFPSIALALLIALFVSLSLGFLTVLIKYAATTIIMTPEEIEAMLPEYPVFAKIHRLPERPSEQQVMQWRETFRALYTSIKFSSPAKKSVIGISSSIPGEGKSLIASALSETYLDFGHKVILIDADMRRPTQHKIANGTATKGLSGYLIDETAHWEKIKISTKYGYDLIPAGAEPPNPALLLASDRFSALIERLAADYDFVIIDAPPLYAATDPMYIIRSVDVFLFVSSVGTVPIEALRRVNDLFFKKISEEKKNIGIVINRAPLSHGGPIGSYHYGSPGPALMDDGNNADPDTRTEKLKKILNLFRKRN